MAPSTSSTSIGMWALVLRGLYVLFDSALPMRFMFCSRQHCLSAVHIRRSYIDLRIVPLVHAQRLDLGNVRPQLAMQRRAAHTQENAQLHTLAPIHTYKADASSEHHRSQCGGKHTLQLAHPAVLSVHIHRAAYTLSLPGFFAPQSAQVPFPGTVLISSCSARSLRACWRLFSAEAISDAVGGASHKGATRALGSEA